MKLALEALENIPWGNLQVQAMTALHQAIAEAEQAHWVGVSDERLMEMPEFTRHTVESTADWSEWVCPDPEGYLMKCCDCGLVHEAQFGVVWYKSETEREDCDKVDDPNLQAVFRMRRHEAWEPKDTAHRAGGLPMEQAQPVGWQFLDKGKWFNGMEANGHRANTEAAGFPTRDVFAAPPQRKPLTDEEIKIIWRDIDGSDGMLIRFARAIEDKHGIKENT